MRPACCLDWECDQQQLIEQVSDCILVHTTDDAAPCMDHVLATSGGGGCELAKTPISQRVWLSADGGASYAGVSTQTRTNAIYTARCQRWLK